MSENSRPLRILLGVTSDVSLTLMRGFPAYLVSRGWDVHVVSSPGKGLRDIASVEGVSIHEVPMEREPSPLRDLVSLFRWIRLLRRIKPTVVSVGTPKAGLLGGFAAWLCRVPRRIYMLRGLRLETTKGAKRGLLALLERTAFASSHGVLAVSPSLRTRAVELRLGSFDKITVLGRGSSNGVKIERFGSESSSFGGIGELRDELGLEADPPVVGFVGRLNADKGLHVLAEACDLLRSRGVEYQLLIVGGVDGDHSNWLEALRACVPKLVVTGHVAEPERYYRMMDLLCLPTLREGFPNVVLEAAASGIPTVTTNATGARDSVESGSTGLITEAGSSQSLAAGLEALILDARKREEFGRNARRHVEEHFRQEDVWRSHAAFFETSG